MSSDMQVGRLDLAARSIDLTTALLKATTSSDSLLKGAWEVIEWIGREKLNRYELLDCMEKARGIVFANRNGQQFFDGIIRGLDAMPVWPLFLQQSGSLGRLMAGDPNLSWIVSTVACLFQHHRDDRVVTDMLTSFILEAHRADGKDDGQSFATKLVYNPEQTRVRAVVRKIVSSVWFNVINVGCDTIPLPQELLSVCPKGHFLDPGDFGVVINAITAHCPSKAILRTDHLLRDVLLWLLLHYDGTVVVNVGGHIVYSADLGNPDRELEVRISSICTGSGNCQPSGAESYKILHNISGKLENFLSGCSFSDYHLPRQPGVRQKLYDVPQLYPTESAMWDKELQILVKWTAQSLMRWLLGISLSTTQEKSPSQPLSPGFAFDPQKSSFAEHMTVSQALKRIPAMINFKWGIQPNIQPRVYAFGPHFDLSSRPGGSRDTSDATRDLIILPHYFPILAHLVGKVSADCQCPECSMTRQATHKQSSGTFKPGCLIRMALEEVLLLLAHGIADGFGVDDVSSVSDISPIIEGTVTLLLDLVGPEHKAEWNTWFMVASCVYLGCPFEKRVSEDHPAFGGTAFAAIQYGNLATQAPWLDMNKEITIHGCFGLMGSRGRIGVVTKNDDRDARFRSVEENFAIIETEPTEDTALFCSRFKKPVVSIDHSSFRTPDTTLVESDVILCQMDDRFYRLLLRVKTKSHWRIVDPSDGLSGLIRILPSATCQHGAQPPDTPTPDAKIYTMDEVVGRWPDTVQSRTSTDPSQRDQVFHMTQVLDSHWKRNIALALSICTTAVPNFPEQACPACSIRHAMEAKRKPLRDGEGGSPLDRYVINLEDRLAEQHSTTQHLLLQQPNTS